MNINGLFKKAQMQGAQKAEPRGVYRNTLSGAVCSATQQMSVFQQPFQADLTITLTYDFQANSISLNSDIFLIIKPNGRLFHT
jgi:adenylylsulfate kinase-like enzyme